MNVKGGYQIVNFKGEAITLGTKKTTLTNVKGEIAKANGKPVIVHGLKVGSTAHTDFYALFTETSTGVYTAVVNVTDELQYKIVVEATGVTVTNLIVSGGDAK